MTIKKALAIYIAIPGSFVITLFIIGLTVYLGNELLHKHTGH